MKIFCNDRVGNNKIAASKAISSKQRKFAKECDQP